VQSTVAAAEEKRIVRKQEGVDLFLGHSREGSIEFVCGASPSVVRQRVIVKDALDTGQRSEMAESLLDALEGSLRLFEKHRVLILGQLQRQPPSKGYHPSAPTRRAWERDGPGHATCTLSPAQMTYPINDRPLD
jgi:hypothetical protein